jgi:hypothetical protein
MTGGENAADLREEFERSAGTPSKARRSKSTTKPFSIRLSEDERRLLLREAGKLSLGAHIRQKLFGDEPLQRPSRKSSAKRREPGGNQKALGQALALLGRSELCGSLQAIARSAVMGALPVTPELVQELQAAIVHVRAMRVALMEPLGIRTDFENDPGR